MGRASALPVDNDTHPAQSVYRMHSVDVPMSAAMAVFPEVEADRTQSQTVKALLAIRELILEGVLAPGKRISELSVAERTGISRTPIRAALQRLEEEGLIATIPS